MKYEYLSKISKKAKIRDEVSFKYVKYSSSKENIRKYIMNDNDFSSVNKNTIDVINVLTNSKIEYKDDEVMKDMCKGLDDLIEEGKQEGIQKGKQEGIIEGNKEKEVEMIRKMNCNGLDVQAISKYLELDIDYVKSILAN